VVDNPPTISLMSFVPYREKICRLFV